jgi:two-component system, NarL family, nitrate/nitrite response regulator NarL
MIVIASSSLKLRHHWRCWLNDEYQIQTAANYNSLKTLLEKAQPEILLLDLALSGLPTADAVSELHRLYPNLTIIVFSASSSSEEELATLKAGARGYCSQDISAELLRKAVERIQQGEIWVTRKLIPSLIEEISSLNQQDQKDNNSLANMYLARLTPREREIATLIGQGANNKIIARKLDITERTVKAHLSEIFRKLSIPDRLQLALLIHGHRPPNHQG